MVEPRLFVAALVGSLQPTFYTLLATVGFVLLITCANVASLFLGAARVIETLLVGVRPLDPIVYAGVAVVFAVVAVLACLVPSLHASRIDPLRALRAE